MPNEADSNNPPAGCGDETDETVPVGQSGREKDKDSESLGQQSLLVVKNLT